MDQPLSDSPQTTDATSLAVGEELRGIWSELLFVESIEDRDNFVALGGDSIAATLCTMRINRAFGVEIASSLVLQNDMDFAGLVCEIEARLALALRERD